MSYVKKKSVLPIYFVGAVWLLWALFGSLYRPIHYVLAALVSIIAYFLGKILFPDRGYEAAAAQEPPKAEAAPVQKEEPKKTYPPEIQSLITERDRAVSEMRRLNDAIKDETISA